MPDPTDRDREIASDIVERLFDRDRDWLSLRAEERPKHLPKDMFIHDVERHVLQFRMEADVLRSLGSPFPGLVFADAAIPFSVSRFVLPFAGTEPPADGQPLLNERFFMARELGRLDALYGLHKFVQLGLDEAKRAFSEGAATSLALRIANTGRTDREAGLHAGALNLPPTSGAPAALATGCRFAVNTNTHGLQVFWSGAYYITPHFFGGPTTPAEGTLQSGTYVFGVSGGAYANVHWDQNAVCSLPGPPNVYLNY